MLVPPGLMPGQVIQQVGAGGLAIGIESGILKFLEHTLHHFTALVVPGRGNGLPHCQAYRSVPAEFEERRRGN
jgi:hypothetical protein